MALKYDSQFKFPLSRKIYFRLGMPSHLVRMRALQRKFAPNPSKQDCFGEGISMFDFDRDQVREEYQRQKWTFVENIFSAEFFELLLQDWPAKRYLNPPRKPTKWYDTGFSWTSSPKRPTFLELHQVMDRFFTELSSPKFLSFLSELSGKELAFANFGLTDCGPGAEVPIHIDGLNKSPLSGGSLGIAFFIDGTGGPESGGLAISKTTEWEDVIFQPTKLTNTALFYDKSLPHGFKPMGRKTFRKSINTAFLPVEMVNQNLDQADL